MSSTTSNDLVVEHLADFEERLAAGQSPEAEDATVVQLKAELETILTYLRQPPQPRTFEGEASCQRVTARVELLGRKPEEVRKMMNTVSGDQQSSPWSDNTSPLGTVGSYELLTKVGEGGMGAVYMARHVKLDKIVAVKVLPPERMQDPGAVHRFEREMRAIGKLEHPHIVRAMDAGEVEGTHFLVMEYVSGVDLSHLVKQLGPLPIADACELVRQAALGLEEAHEHAMVHRDIKPSNLMLCAGNEKKPPVVKVLDLGLALLSDVYSPDARTLTASRQTMGTLDYMAPEQGDDSHEVDIRADIYSLGVSLYKLLCGEALYQGQKFRSPMQKLMALATLPAPPIRDRRPDVPESLAAVVHRMLAKSPEQRYATPAEVATALAPFCPGANLTALLERVGYDATLTTDRSQSSTHGDHRQSSSDTGAAATAELPGSTVVAPTSSRAESLPRRDRGSSVTATQPVPVPVPTGSPRSSRPWLAIGGLLGFGGFAWLFATVFFFETEHGTLRVEVTGGEAEVSVKGTDIVITNQGQPEVNLQPGSHSLVVSRGDLSFETDKLELKAGETTTVRVEWLPGKVQVVDGQRVIGQRALQAVAPQLAGAEGAETTPAVSLLDPAEPSVGLRFANPPDLSSKDHVATPLILESRRGPLTIEAIVNPNAPGKGRLFGTSYFAVSETGQPGQLETRIFVHEDEMQTGAVVKGKLPERRRPLHIASIWTGDKLRLFVDGQLIGETDVPRGQLHKHHFTFGNGINGTMREVRVSSSARYTENFVPATRLAPDGKTLALYHCDEGEGDVVYDSSGNDHHGKLMGAATWVRP